MAEQPRDQIQGSSIRHQVGNKPVNLNKAGREELMSVRGIGPGRADEIIAHRNQHGPFGSVSDLQQLNLVDPGEMAELRDRLTV
ncbi:helix-hairpin-helix domain-containing protein [Aerophototrophica crusticola]|uniref:Helix-hairpin-helix domain-containing protein n=1 Tax=Aerophototrophica crusticola TaxID=1709002 RepID=A0A858RBH2_9PROT|nr:helix-hairpin-helix domain-containing protein [Rhodospirillaceae bacterium B3]